MTSCMFSTTTILQKEETKGKIHNIEANVYFLTT